MTRTNIWFPFYVGDYRAETQGFSHEERGVFVELLCVYTHRQAPLPDDDKQLAKLVGLTLPKWKRMRLTIAPVFTINKGTWRLQRLDEQIARSSEIREKRRLSGRLGGLKSGAKRQAYAEAFASDESKQMLNKSKSKLYKPLSVIDRGAGFEVLDLVSAGKLKVEN